MKRQMKWAILGSLMALPTGAAAFDCVIEPAIVVQLASPVGGLLDEVLVARGDLVEQGQVIARLRSEIEQNSIELYEARADSEAEIAAQQARLNLALSRVERVRTLLERNIATGEQMEEAAASVEVATRELNMAQLQQKLAKLELARAREVLEQRTVKSSIDGVVMERLLFAGEYADQDTPIIVVAKLDPLHVEAFLPVDVNSAIKIGMEATITLGEPFKGTYAGKVSVIDRVFDAASGSFGVRVELPNPDLHLPAGQRCEVEFNTGG